MKEENYDVKNSARRLVFVVFAVFMQFVWIIVLYYVLAVYAPWLTTIMGISAAVITIAVYSSRYSPDTKLPWIILIAFFPVMGVLLYLMMNFPFLHGRIASGFIAIDQEFEPYLEQDPLIKSDIEALDYGVANQMHYIHSYGTFPVYRNSDIHYFNNTTDALKAQKDAIRKAKSFIFMEYHAIEDAESFNELRQLLVMKVKQGVQVRIIYDDVGSFSFINSDFIKRMAADQIECRVFNRVMPLINFFMNHRDHRKMTIVDGTIAFTGGYNLANKYFNREPNSRYGHWKDLGIVIEGDAVRNFTVMFLEMWNAIKHTDLNYEQFLVKQPYTANEPQGFLQPYGDTPLDHEHVGENAYLNLIKNAKHYLYIMTPYLIISEQMNNELCLAAKRGVDIHIITPGIPDKKLVYEVTRSYYRRLVESNIHIHEYKPGFSHGKIALCDDEIAIVGTINFDFRSFYHHFENAVLIYHYRCIADIKKDFENTFLRCEDVTERYQQPLPAWRRVYQSLLRLFAPLI